MKPVFLVAASITMLTLAGCAATTATTPIAPPAVVVPAGHAYALTLVGKGDLTYECRTANNASQWSFVAPDAQLITAEGKVVGKYYGGPTWELNDGSKLVGKQLAIAPATRAGAIPLQLVEVTINSGVGQLRNTTYIQRLDTQGGVAPAVACTSANTGQRMTVPYSADYAFYVRS